MRRSLLPLLVLAGLLGTAARAGAADRDPLVVSWLLAQTNIQSWSADFVQTRSFKTLTQPLTKPGHVWFEQPNRFRWELGQPVETIAVRAPKELLVIYPGLKRVERYPLTGGRSSPWRDALALLEAGFPRDQAGLAAQYNLLHQTVSNQTCELTLQPKSAAARRMMPQIKIDFDTKDFALRGTEMQIADGSTLRNDFDNARLNPKVDQEMFAPRIPSDYKIVEPLQNR